MRPYETPDILQSELSEVVLQMRVLGINNLTSFDFMDKPNPEVYKKAIADLQAIGALENNPEAKPMPYGIKVQNESDRNRCTSRTLANVDENLS